MSQRLSYQTHRKFDKCTELLRNILSVQESHENNNKSSIAREQNQTKRQLNKSSFKLQGVNHSKETSINQPSYFQNKNSSSSIGVTKLEDALLLKNRQSPNQCRKHLSRSPCLTSRIHQGLKSTTKNNLLINNKLPTKTYSSSLFCRNRKDDELLRSSSCTDLSSISTGFIRQEKENDLHDQFHRYLSRIQTISTHIRIQYCKNFSDQQCHYLWNELESCLESALSYVNHGMQHESSLLPLRNEIIELKKQLQTTNLHLHEYDLTHRNKKLYAHLQEKFDANRIQYIQSLLHNKELKAKCKMLQDKIDHLERNNVSLIQRITQQDLRSIVQNTPKVSKTNDLFLEEEYNFFKEKLYHIYDDVVTLSDRNQTLENLLKEQNIKLLLYKQQINNLKELAENLLHDLDKNSNEYKIKQFLQHVLHGQKHMQINQNASQETYLTRTKSALSNMMPSSILFQKPRKLVKRTQLSSPNSTISKVREKSFFVKPVVLNDSSILSKFQCNEISNTDVTSSSSTAIEDADSILLNSSFRFLSYEHRKSNSLHNSLPILPILTNTDMIKENVEISKQQSSNDESDPELNQISDLTSKMFSSENEDDYLVAGNSTSMSSSITSSSNTKKRLNM